MYNIKKMELKRSIYEDTQSEIHKYYDTVGIKYKDKEIPQDTIVDFFSYLFRLIPVIERKVHYSEELLNKIEKNEISKESVEILKIFEDAFSRGKDMNIFLSNKIKSSRETDFLRYTWHLFHLHMSNKFVEDKEQMKNNRSDTQLLCIIDSNDVYFIDVISHPRNAEEYFNIKSLEIILNNDWMEKIGFYEMKDMIPGTLKPKIVEDKDIFELYSQYSVNLSFEFKEKGYCSLEPMNCTRRSFVATNELIKIANEIEKLGTINGTYIGFHLECDSEGMLMGIVQFMTSEGKCNSYNIF